MNTYQINVLRNKTAKAIVNRCYEEDKSAVIDTTGMATHGSSIHCVATKCTTSPGCTEYSVVIKSAVLEQSTLVSLVDEVFVAINAHKTAK